MMNRKHHTTSRKQRISWTSCLLLLLASFLACSCPRVSHAKEIEATSEWTLLEENDTVAAGMHVRMDLTTGEKWVKTIDDDESEIEQVQGGGNLVGGTNLAVIDANGNVETTTIKEDEAPNYDYEMMHQALSHLPPDEQERMGGIPKLPEKSSEKITPEQRAVFEKRMKEIWEQRQEELKIFQDDHLADLPQLLKDRIASIEDYLKEPIPELQALDVEAQQEESEEGVVGNILKVLQDLEYQLTDVDMARDFYTLGGWPLLSSLLADAVHETQTGNVTEIQLTEADWNKVNLLQAHAAWAIGTAVKNTGEFSPWATVQVEVQHDKTSSVKTTTLDLVLAQFVASSKAVLETTHPKDDYYDSVMMKVHKSLYALGSLLRANRQAQTHFCADQGPALLAKILSVFADQSANKDALPRDTLKVVQRLLALAQDIVMDVTLHDSASAQVDEAIRKAFTSDQWCNTLLRFLPIPRLYEPTLLTIQQLAPHCSWNDDIKEVSRQVQEPPADVRQAWLPEDLDMDLKEERTKLLEDTLTAIRANGGQKQS